jgi:hypothetical protein
MNPGRSVRGVVYAAALALAATVACRLRDDTRPMVEPPPPGIAPTHIDYVDADAFDGLFETALTNQDPAILIQTAERKPDWSGRLNAWIAAWNQGGRVQPGPAPRTARGQIPSVTVDGDTLRELRMLVDDFMDRVEGRAKERSAWWAEEKVRARRVALLRPYNLRFHLDDAGMIQLIFFNGRYAGQYREFMQGIGADAGEGWDRCISCSRRRHDSAAVRANDGAP